eukprot:6065372-Prymnesium_polylepis.1
MAKSWYKSTDDSVARGAAQSMPRAQSSAARRGIRCSRVGCAACALTNRKHGRPRKLVGVVGKEAAPRLGRRHAGGALGGHARIVQRVRRAHVAAERVFSPQCLMQQEEAADGHGAVLADRARHEPAHKVGLQESREPARRAAAEHHLFRRVEPVVGKQ